MNTAHIDPPAVGQRSPATGSFNRPLRESNFLGSQTVIARFMPKAQVNLEILERIVSAGDAHTLAEAALAGLCEISPGDHFSAILFNPVTLAAEAFFPHQGWLPSGNAFRDAASGKLIEHPLARKFLNRQQSMALLRSREVRDKEWHRSFIYNELDRPLGVKDIATVYQVTATKRVLVLTCGRSRRFSDDEFTPIQAYHRILNRLPQFQPMRRCPDSTPIAKPSDPDPLRKLATLTTREREILHWVRNGKQDPEIAIILGISLRTVNHHMANIRRKLEVGTRTAAAMFR
jgi:DNA-binding CsgD family transcriptional regulator